MGTSKLLQTPQVIEILGSTIRIKHPDVSGYSRTEVNAPLTAAGTTLTVADNNNLEDNDWFVLGEVGDAKTEECDVNGAVTRGTSVTITNSTKFSHEIHAPVIRVLERGIKIYGAATDGGTGTLIASVDAITSPIADAVSIQWDKEYTEYNLISTDTTYAYYFVKFTDGTTDSSASVYVLAAGLSNASVEKMVEAGLNECNAEVDGNMITREWLLNIVNDWQDEVTNYITSDGIIKDWSFELFEDKTSIASTENENTYALSGFSSTLKYTDSYQGILNVKFGSVPLKYRDITYWDNLMRNIHRTEVEVEASAADTTLTVDDSAEFSSSGSVYVGGDLVTYTTNTVSTGVLSGVPASGTGSITETHAVDAAVWQGVTPGLPEFYTIFNGSILLNVPVDDDYVGYKIKVKGLKKLDRLTSYSSATIIPFTYLAKYYIAAKIESRKNNATSAKTLLDEFSRRLEIEARRDGLQTLDIQSYYTFRPIDPTGDNDVINED